MNGTLDKKLLYAGIRVSLFPFILLLIAPAIAETVSDGPGESSETSVRADLASAELDASGSVIDTITISNGNIFAPEYPKEDKALSESNIDRDSRVYGSEVVPVERFHIPGLILGGSISAEVFDPVASQIDLASTVLSLIGIAAEHPMIGHDLSRSDELLFPGRAIMQLNGTQAYLAGDRVAILQKDMPVRQYSYVNQQLIADNDDYPQERNNSSMKSYNMRPHLPGITM